MRLIQRWGLMRNTQMENIQEHSLQVAMIAHGLAVIRNIWFNGALNPERVLSLAVYHEVGEVITGDLPTPIKYFNPEIKKAYNEIEELAKQKLIHMLPEECQTQYNEYFFHTEADQENWRVVKAADKLSAYLKCMEELRSGNEEFFKAKNKIEVELRDMQLPEVRFFLDHFAPSFALTLDELN
jgi:5'-deoxynucleotidase